MVLQISLVAVAIGIALAVFLRYMKASVGLALAGAAVVGTLVSGYGLPLRRFAEGATAYLYFNLVVIVAGILITLLRDHGLLKVIIGDIVRLLHRRPYLLLIGLGFATMLPGALTGSGTVGVLAMGGLVGPILATLGLNTRQIAAVVGVSGVLSLVAPPVNVYGMIMSAGLNMPYQDTLVPALWITLGLEVICLLWIAWGKLKPSDDLQQWTEEFPTSSERAQAYLPLGVIFALVIASRLFPLTMPPLGLPGIFVVGVLLLVLLRRNVKELHEASLRTMDEMLPILGIMTGIGVLVQVLSLTGVKGLLVTGIMVLPLALAYASFYVLLPLAGSILAFGAAAVFGLPFLWANAGIDPRISIVGLSLAISIGAMIPPTALVGRFALSSVGYEGSYMSFARSVAAPVLLINAVGILVAVYANQLTFLLGG